MLFTSILKFGSLFAWSQWGKGWGITTWELECRLANDQQLGVHYPCGKVLASVAAQPTLLHSSSSAKKEGDGNQILGVERMNGLGMPADQRLQAYEISMGSIFVEWRMVRGQIWQRLGQIHGISMHIVVKLHETNPSRNQAQGVGPAQ